MASEQAHGKDFEQIVLAQSGLQVPHTFIATPGGAHDIPLASARDAIPVSVKTVQFDINQGATRPTIGLADAVRFFHTSTSTDLRIVVGLHHPTAQGPMVYEIHECITTPAMQQGLWGELTGAHIQAFADAIKTWAREDDAEGISGRKRACEHARQHKRMLLPLMGHIDLSPKISAHEARLQCAIPVYTLRRECLNAGSYATIDSALTGRATWRSIALPLLLRGGKRTAAARA